MTHRVKPMSLLQEGSDPYLFHASDRVFDLVRTPGA